MLVHYQCNTVAKDTINTLSIQNINVGTLSMQYSCKRHYQYKILMLVHYQCNTVAKDTINTKY